MVHLSSSHPSTLFPTLFYFRFTHGLDFCSTVGIDGGRPMSRQGWLKRRMGLTNS